MLQATSIHISDTLAFIGYGQAGPGETGAIDVVDISDPLNPVLINQAAFPDADVNDVYEEGGSLFAALAGRFAFSGTAAISRIPHTSGILSLGAAATVGLDGFAATSVMSSGASVYATSGTDGVVARFDATSLALTASSSVADARWVDVEGGLTAVHGGNEVAIFDTDLTPLRTVAIARSLDDEAKAKLFIEGGRAFATGGGSGVQIVSLSTGLLHQSISVPAFGPLGLQQAEVVANAVANSGVWMFSAMGSAGVYVYRAGAIIGSTGSENHEPLTLYGSLGGLDSANDLTLSGSTLAVASGGGVRILDFRDSVDVDWIAVPNLNAGGGDVGMESYFNLLVDDPTGVLDGNLDGNCIDVDQSMNYAVFDFDNDGVFGEFNRTAPDFSAARGVPAGTLYFEGSAQPFTATVYSSYDEAVTSDGLDGLLENFDNLDLVNWIINQRGPGELLETYSAGEIQFAIWELIDDTPPFPVDVEAAIGINGGYDPMNVVAIKDLATMNGEGYIPTAPTDLVGMIFVPDGNVGPIDGIPDEQTLLVYVQLSRFP